MIAGMHFMPLLPTMLAIGFGAWARQWRLSLQGAMTLGTALILLAISGIVIGVLSQPPIRYTESNGLMVSMIISLAVGIAAALANVDDVGRRELIGLAATAQVAVIPVWLGLCLIMGLPSTVSQSEVTERAMMLFLNIAIVVISSLATYIVLGAIPSGLARIKTRGVAKT